MLTPLIFALTLSLLMLLVLYFDITQYIIPNWLVGMVSALYVVFYFSATVPVDWVAALMVAAIAFAVGFVLFILKVMGGGDVKLLAACGFWIGTVTAMPFLFYMAIVGGVLSLLLLAGRPAMAYFYLRQKADRALPRVLQVGSPIPYGVAIAGAFLWVMWTGQLPGLPVKL